MTLQDSSLIRAATKQDGLALAKLIDIAGEGIPSWVWGKLCGDGQAPLTIGTERARRETGGFSYTHALLAQQNGHPAGMVLSYPLLAGPQDDPDDLPAPIAPFVELEKHSVDTWFINALAVFASHRNAGIGQRLIAAAEGLARSNGYARMSIQVYEQNSGAVRLYERLGYKRANRASVRHHPCQPYYTGDVLLLIRQLG
ncbi:MAG: GNAT family N-acetyltransferase [Pseudomonadota bacterium]